MNYRLITNENIALTCYRSKSGS